jgi:hypothetical protein
MWKCLHVKYPLFLSDFNETWIFSTDFRKKAQITSFIKIRPVGAELFHADGQTDMTKLRAVFRSFVNAPNKLVIVISYVVCANHVICTYPASWWYEGK